MHGSTSGTTGMMSYFEWSNREIFKQYLNDHFLKYVRQSSTEKVHLLYDGYSSQISQALIQWDRKKIYCRPAQVPRPLDVGVFGPLLYTITPGAAISSDRTLAGPFLGTTLLV